MGFNGKSGFIGVVGGSGGGALFGGGGAEVPFYIEKDLVFDFDFEKTEKQSLRDSLYLENFIDRGITLGQYTATKQPIIDTQGLKFDGVDDLMVLGATQGKEIWLVCNNLDGAVFNERDGLFSTPLTSEDYIYSNPNRMSFRFPYPSMKINNTYGHDFHPLSTFKSVSQEMNNGNTLLDIGTIADIYCWNGYIKRILIYDTIKTEQERTKIQFYLYKKYSL